MKRPLLVAHNAEAGGSNDVVLTLLQNAPDGTDPAVLFLDDGPLLDEVRRRGITAALIQAGRARQVWKAPVTIERIRRVVRRLQADVVFAHVTKAHLYAGPAAAMEGLPYLWWRHELPGQKLLQHAVAGRLPASRVLCSSDFCGAMQLARWPGTPVRRVYPGTRTDGVEGPRRHIDAGETPLIGMVSRLQRWKRVERLLDAMPAVLNEIPGTRAVIYGGATSQIDPDYPDELLSRARELGVDYAVKFCGHVPRAADRMLELDVVVHTADLEPFGLVVVEALLRGVPVVAPHLGGPAEIIRDGVDGLLADPDDPRALSSAIVKLLRDPERRTSMGVAGRQRVLERFEATRMSREAWGHAFEVWDNARIDVTRRHPVFSRVDEPRTRGRNDSR